MSHKNCNNDNNCFNNSGLGFCGISPCCLLIAAAIFFRRRGNECNRNCRN